MREAWKRWEQMSQILGREVADSRTFRKFYKVVIQAKLLFGGESWVVSPLIGRTLGGFHYRVARQLENI